MTALIDWFRPNVTMIETRQYNHSRKAGNAGDVWKHFILLTVADSLADTGQFTYAETHSGIGTHYLGENGEWQEGIGRVLQTDCQVFIDNPYFQLAQTHYTQSQSYLGSWSLLSEHLGKKDGLSCSFHLFDTSSCVAEWFQSAALPSPVRISYLQGDGFKGIHSIMEKPDLVLIDPPYKPEATSDWHRVNDTVLYLLEAQFPFLAWYPLFGSINPQHLVDSTGRCTYEVQWPLNQSQNLSGCGMIVSPVCEMILTDNSEMLAILANVLNGDFRIFRP